MGSKTISLSEKAYQRLRAQRRGAGDSFSQIVLRAHWEGEVVTAGELLERWRDLPPFFTSDELSELTFAKQAQSEPEDKWNDR
jgi:hypothetical protein